MQLHITSLQNKGLLEPLIFVIMDLWIALMFGTLPLPVLRYYLPGLAQLQAQALF